MRTLMLTLGLLMALPATAVGRSPAASPTPGHTPLEEAVAFLPSGAHDLGFTDWSRIRASLGAEGVTGASPMDQKLEVLMATNEREAAGSAFGAAYLRHHRDAWAWDTLDVDWEAILVGDGPPVSVVRLREGTDVEAIEARYDGFGFATEATPGGTIRSHGFDPTADWVGTTELAVSNTAFLDDGRTLLFSSGADALRDALGRVARTPLPGEASVIDALAGASAAWLTLAPGCAAFTPLPFDPFDPNPSIGPLPTGEPLHPWTALGVGYGRPDWDPVGRVAMGFLSPGHAQADLAPRTTLAREGVSQRLGLPYADAVFTLDGSEVVGDALVLRLSPADDRPQRLFQMLQARDMTFAGC